MRRRSKIVRPGLLFALVALVFAAVAPSPSQHADAADTANQKKTASAILHEVAEIHGAPGPFAVAGYRIGERALRELNLPRGSFAVEVIHRTPFEVQWSCIADGLQAATGASAGKLNLRLVETPQDQLATVIKNRKTGEELIFRLNPAFLKSFLNLSPASLDEAGSKVLELQEDEVFSMVRQSGK